MFLLIHIRMEQGQPERYFNTSHVSINLSLYPIHVYVHHDFNTSHVSINLKPYPWHHSTVFISIHLMFLLIQRWELYRHSKGGYFNTSHVSINHTGSIATTCVVRDFNTSHVSINLIHILPFWNAYRISIHLMFLLIAAAAPSDNTATVISIHLMFLLIRYPIRSRWIRNTYFNTSHVSINPSCNCG